MENCQIAGLIFFLVITLPRLHKILELVTFEWDFLDLLFSSSPFQSFDKERCVICQMEYKRGDKRIILLSKHLYHTGCGSRWLSINKFSVFEMESAAGQSDGGDSGTVRWPRQETFTLLDIRSRLDSRFKEANQKGPLWDELSRYINKMEERGHKTKRTMDGGKHKKFIEALKLYGRAWRRI